MRKIATVFLAAFLLAGCDESNGAQGIEHLSSVAEVEVSAISPDAAVKSWWRLRDAETKDIKERCEIAMNKSSAQVRLRDLSSGDALKVIETRNPCLLTDYHRDILNVDIQSDTRAVVLAKITNITAPEDGVTLTFSELEEKEKGEELRYLLERDAVTGPWKVAQIYYFSTYREDWVPVFKKPDPDKNISVSVGMH